MNKQLKLGKKTRLTFFLICSFDSNKNNHKKWKLVILKKLTQIITLKVYKILTKKKKWLNDWIVISTILLE